jgi:hypothetical protein
MFWRRCYSAKARDDEQRDGLRIKPDPSFCWNISPHVGDPQLSIPVLFQKPKLLGSYLILLEAILRSMEGAHVTDKGPGDIGR